MKIKMILPVMAVTFALVAGLLPLQAAAVPPGQIKIDQMSKDFGPVMFDHASHVEMVGDCSTCHHHTTGTAAKNPDCRRCHDSGGTNELVACSACHVAAPFSAEYLKKVSEDRHRYHRDIPGLKGAFHSSCTGCHEESGGPTGCLDCHPRTDAGDALFRAGKYLPSPSARGAEH